MAHPAVVVYLRANKNRFPEAVLRQQLLQQGYPDAVIAAAAAEVYGIGSAQSSAATSRFFSSHAVFCYRTTGQRVGHFLLGLLLGGAFSLTAYLAYYGVGEVFLGFEISSWVMLTGLVVVRLGLLVWFFLRRQWLAWGLLAATVLWFSGELRMLTRIIF